MSSTAGVLCDAEWFTSSYSNDQGGNCVAGARLAGAGMAVRDSKCPEGPAFVFPREVWGAFVCSVKTGGLS